MPQNGGNAGHRADVGNVRINDVGQEDCRRGLSHVMQGYQNAGL